MAGQARINHKPAASLSGGLLTGASITTRFLLHAGLHPLPANGEVTRRPHHSHINSAAIRIRGTTSRLAVYVIRRGFFSFDVNNAAYIRVWIPVRLPWTLLLSNTAVLIISSCTIELARREITREAALAPVQSIPGISLGDERRFPWLGLTTVLGLLFLAGQLFVWSKLSAEGFHLVGGTSSSFVYILTAMHGLHLAGGVLALIFANIAAVLRRPVETRRIVVDITSWYWHCMTGLWIYILVLFSFAA